MVEGGQREKLRVVVDASVIAKWFIPGEPWEAEARVLEERIVTGEVEAYAPSLLLYEVASIMLKAAHRSILRLDDGIKALEALGQIGLKIQENSWSDLTEILKIATTTRLTVYDSTYLHLAKKLNAKLITADMELKQRGEKITEILLIKDLKP